MPTNFVSVTNEATENQRQVDPEQWPVLAFAEGDMPMMEKSRSQFHARQHYFRFAVAHHLQHGVHRDFWNAWLWAHPARQAATAGPLRGGRRLLPHQWKVHHVGHRARSCG